MNRKELKIDRTMEYGQSRLIDWDHVAEVKEDLLAKPPDGRLHLLGRQRYGNVGLQFDQRNGLLCLPCVMYYDVVFSRSLVRDWRPHGVAACDEICKDGTTMMGELEDWMTNFDVRIIKFDTSVEIRRQLAGQHNRAQHNGRESSVPQPLNNFLQLAAEETQCKKAVVTLMCEAVVEAGLTAKCGNTEPIVKQMRPAAHMAVMCGTAVTDALSKMVERKHVIALYTVRRFAGMQPENVWRVCNYMALPKSKVPGFWKLAKELRSGELWWYHFGHPDMPVECIHSSRRKVLPCKPLAFRCETL